MALLAELICDVPAKGKMQLMSLSASEGLSRPFEYQVEILSDKADLDLAKFLGKSMTVALELPEGTRHFNGLVSRFAHSGRRTRQFFHYQATLRPWFWFLSRTQDCRIFQEKTVVQIMEDVFADHASLAKVSKKLSGSYTPWEYCVQYRESDMNFVSRLMEQEGLYYYFEHTQSGHELVLCDSISAHNAAAGYEKLPYEANWSEAHGDQAEGINGWSVGMQVLPTKVVLADYDFTRPAHQLRKEHAVARQHDLNSYEVFDYPGEYVKDADGQAYARIRAQEQQAGFQVASAQTDARGISCGSTFKVEGLPDVSQDGEYLVLATNIFIEEGVQIGGEDGGRGRFSCDFQAMPTSDTFRAPRLTPKPMVHGPQTAMVVGPDGEHIHTDQYGRVKVQFHWDRLGQNNDKSSCWMRVSQPWAGKSFGAINIPRIGDEVVVSFLEGDPDQPLITGRVYNEGFMPPYDLPAQAHVTGIYTRSKGSAAGAEANELRFSDEPGKEYFSLQAQKDFYREVENDDSELVKQNQFIKVGGNRQDYVVGTADTQIDGNVTVTHKADHHLTVTGDYLQKGDGVMNYDVTGDWALKSAAKVGAESATDMALKAGTDLAAEGGMNVHVKGGMNVTIQAGMTLTLKAGAATIVLGPSGVSIDGPLVNINCGGGGGAAKSATPPKPAAPKAPKEPTDHLKKQVDALNKVFKA